MSSLVLHNLCSQIWCLSIAQGALKSLMPTSRLTALQLPVRRPGMIETTCLGAAYAAGIGIGFWTVEDIFDTPLEGETFFQPEMSPLECRSKYRQWTAAVRKSFDAD